jgi:transposase
MQLTNKKLKKTLEILDVEKLLYKQTHPKKKRDWRTYEQQAIKRLETAFDELQPLVYEAVNSIKIVKHETRGAKPSLNLEQKVLILLLKHIFGNSNRTMSAMFVLFSWLTGIKVGYKTIERLYSDELVIIALKNLHSLTLEKKEIEEVDIAGDGTGYSLTIRKHYASYAQKLKDKAKENTIEKKSKKKKKYTHKRFLYSFGIMDLKTRLYVAYGTSFRSERDAYNKAIYMLKKSKLIVKSIRLDKYFSTQKDVEMISNGFKNIKCYLIPKINATIKGSSYWKDMLKQFVTNTQDFLFEYYKRNQSESGFSEDKKRTGWKLGQKRFDRLDTANILTYVWHNLYWLAD